MATREIKLPDVGEGVAEAELVEWHVAVGDVVREDDVLAVVMTDKASIEVPSSSDGKVSWLGGEVGDTIAVGSVLVRLDDVAGGGATEAKPETDGESDDIATDAEESRQETREEPEDGSSVGGKDAAVATPDTSSAAPAPEAKLASSGRAEDRKAPTRRPARGGEPGERPLAAPSVRQRARDAGVDLRHVSGTGPAGRITHDDIDAHLADDSLGSRPTRRSKNASVKEIKIVGLRRRIAERMAIANTHIPHITIVEEVDVENLEDLRAELNENYKDTRPKLTILPFVMKAIVEAVAIQPQLNAHFDDEAGVVSQFGGVHVGIATQTPNGLMVPVVRHCETRSLWDSASEITRLAEGAREGTLERDELSGSTITITSLGPLGAIATTPIINHPEVAIVGINKIAVRPWWDGKQFDPRRMMNISCSFDHRVVDGWDAAVFVQKLKSLIEKPAMLFVGN